MKFRIATSEELQREKVKNLRVRLNSSNVTELDSICLPNVLKREEKKLQEILCPKQLMLF